ncbi:MAG TPA: SDR family oxidoreductase [Candidatus Acidoferrum sp.]|jgi:meso-butanediol dehydrogenase/(S,S)-butanediol dehydrogenase/diacetyl reductase
MKEFETKVAIVTGTTGIARGIAKRLASHGASVTAFGIDAAANRELQKEADAEGMPIYVELCDVSQPKQVQAAVGKASARFGGIDCIANAAAIHPFGSVVETDPESWNRCMAVNLGGVYLLAHFGIPEMKKRGGGSIVIVASVQGHACQQGVAAYAASKGGLHSLTRALALDHAPDRIRVNSISPGSIRTPMLEHAARHFSPDLPVDIVVERFGAAHPLGRVGTVAEVAELAAFLLSERSAFCTGGDYLVDGGLLAGIAVK